MIVLFHENCQKVIAATRNGKEIFISLENLVPMFWRMALEYPEELIVWVDSRYRHRIQMENFTKIFHHDLIMASFAVENTFLSSSIGYIDQSPSVVFKRDVLFGTWQMSSDVGGIKGKVLARFYTLMGDIPDFQYLINSIGKLGQQNSLFCYSAPGLVKEPPVKSLVPTASRQQLFTFVYQHYNSVWLMILIWCLYKHEKMFPVKSLLRGFKAEKYFQKKVDLSEIPISSCRFPEVSETIDVIIPTIGRREYLYNVLKDFSKQTLLPRKVIIVEQNSDLNSVSDLDYLKKEKWPFEIIHHFIRRTGACNARNIALKEVASDWVFFADDDIRIPPNLLKHAFKEIHKYGIDALNMNCIQEGENVIFKKVKQWGSFGSGTSIVRTSFAKKCSFSIIYEHGYGEDLDYGMQLRNLGCDIIYHPGLSIHHLKAPRGGFREKHVMKWETEGPKVKPSPTLMAYALKNYSVQQFEGYKISLFLKYYNKQPLKDPFKYKRKMTESWSKSRMWAEKLLLLEIKVQKEIA